MSTTITISVPPVLEGQIEELRAAVRRQGGRELTREEAVLLAMAEGLEQLHLETSERPAG
jgi:hypothetical protein